MKIEWSDSLLTGVDFIDEQHQQLFLLINKLLAAFGRGNEDKELEPAIRFLVDYIRKHFKAEETLMRHISYPGEEAHKEYHRAYIEDFKSIVLSVTSHSPNDKRAMTKELNILLCDWWINHISRIDMGLGSYIKRRYPGVSLNDLDLS